MNDAAWLIMPLRKKRSGTANTKPKPWIKSQPRGVALIDQILRDSGAKVGTCSPLSAKDEQIVLVSLTSEHDMISFYSVIHDREHWQPGNRKFKVIAGGFGMQNPQCIRNYVDYAYFGRAEDEVVELIKTAQRGEPSTSISVMNLPDIHPVQVRQARTMYEEMIGENFTGCPLKCKFCHYTHARKHVGSDHAYSKTIALGKAATYVNTEGLSGRNGNYIQITWPQLMEWPHEKVYPRVALGLDGPSERIRFLFGKRISDQEVTDGLSRYAHVFHERGGKRCKMSVYDIGGMPTESAADRDTLHKALAAVETPNDLEMFGIDVQLTPFKPSVWTPMQWEAFAMTDYRARHKDKKIAVLNHRHRRFEAGRPICASHFARYFSSIESPGSQCEYACVNRHDGSTEADIAFHVVATTSRWRNLRSVEKVQAFNHSFKNFAPKAIGQRDIDDTLPSSIATATVNEDALRKIAKKMRGDVEKSLSTGGNWRRGKSTITGARLSA